MKRKRMFCDRVSSNFTGYRTARIRNAAGQEEEERQQVRRPFPGRGSTERQPQGSERGQLPGRSSREGGGFPTDPTAAGHQLPLPALTDTCLSPPRAASQRASAAGGARGPGSHELSPRAEIIKSQNRPAGGDLQDHRVQPRGPAQGRCSPLRNFRTRRVHRRERRPVSSLPLQVR